MSCAQDALAVGKPAAEADLAGAATTLGASVDELLELSARELDMELAALELRPLVLKRIQKEWAARKEGGAAKAAVKPAVSPAHRLSCARC